MLILPEDGTLEALRSLNGQIASLHDATALLSALIIAGLLVFLFGVLIRRK